MSSELEIQREAQLAVNRVLTAHRGMAALKMRPEIRKAFPFGPKATDQERQIWEQTVKKAEWELSLWPHPLMEGSK